VHHDSVILMYAFFVPPHVPYHSFRETSALSEV
jgi:hypothetical protein